VGDSELLFIHKRKLKLKNLLNGNSKPPSLVSGLPTLLEDAYNIKIHGLITLSSSLSFLQAEKSSISV